MNQGPAPQLPFQAQRLVFFALLMGVVMFALVVAVVLQQNGGKGLAATELPLLDTLVLVVGSCCAIGALLLRSVLQGSIEAKQGAARQIARFRATLIPLAMLEGGCLFALTVWMMHGKTVPALVTALVLLSIGIAILPLSDPDAGSGRS